MSQKQLAPIEISEVQRRLKELKYLEGEVDGKLGIKTIQSLHKYSSDLCFVINEQFPGSFERHSAYYKVIAEAHSDWKSVISDLEFGNWLNNQPEPVKKIAMQRGNQDPSIINILINRYKFAKEAPTPLEPPKTGILAKTYKDGIAPFRIITRDNRLNHYIKIINIQNKHVILTGFIRGGETIDIKMPLGVYELRYAVGEKWYGNKHMFGPSTYYAKADEQFEFSVKDNTAKGYQVELYLQINGNLGTLGLDEFDF